MNHPYLDIAAFTAPSTIKPSKSGKWQKLIIRVYAGKFGQKGTDMTNAPMTTLLGANTTIPVSLVKPRISDVPQNVYITDGTFIDEFILTKLTNSDILRVIGKALSIGYRDFTIYRQADHTKVVEYSREGNITVNWDIVRILRADEWK